MSFPANIYLLAFVAGFAVSCASLPLWRTWCRRTGLVDDPGHRKIHHTPIPLAGGLAVMTGLAVPVVFAAFILWSDLVPLSTSEALSYGLGKRAGQLAAILAGAAGMLALGFIDDKYELSPALKFSGQVLVAALVAASGVRITLFVDFAPFSYVVTILWILTVINAFNFMDNMNGLCTGLGVIGAAGFGLSAALHGQYLVAALALLISGALLGFLPYNFPNASAFLGDAGSHLTGYLLGVMAILPHFYSAENPNVWAVLNPFWLLAVPLGDLVCVVIIRWQLGKPFYVGDNNHLSHRLVRRGYTKSKTVLLIWLLAVALSSLAFL